MAYGNIFKPIQIGGVSLKNRIIMVPMGVFSPNMMNLDDASYTKQGQDYYLRRAEGGAGLLISGLVSIAPEDPNWTPITRDAESYIRNTRRLADGVHAHGAKMFIQLTSLHGRVGNYFQGPTPSPLPNVWDPTKIHPEIAVETIHSYIRGFADGAAIVKEAGLDGVEIHAMHEGYLVDQFTIAATNHRTDEYGGSLENRLRYPIEIVQAIKAKCGKDFPVSLRFSVRSMMKAFNRGAVPGEEFVEFGRDIEEALLAAKLLQDAGYDMLDADNGSYDAWYWAHPPLYMPKACNLPDVARLKTVVDIPVACAGRFDDPDTAEKAIAEGQVDMMGLGRPLLADPDLPNKLFAGKADDVRPCLFCHQGCFSRIVQGYDMGCAVNAACGREESYALQPAQTPKKVLVVGGGLAGMEAARVAALRGHSVTLCEKTSALGGVFVAAASPDFKEDDRRLLDWYKKQIQELPISLELNCAVDEAMVAAGGYDEVFIATGAYERTLDIPGLNTQNSRYAKDFLYGHGVSGQSVLVVGAGLTGVEIAYDLARKGKAVTLIEMADTILNVDGLCAANYNMLMDLLDYYKVTVLKGTVLDSWENGSATLTQTLHNYPNIANRALHSAAIGPAGRKSTFTVPADAVILSVGYKSDDALYQKLSGPNVHLLGDAAGVGNVLSSVWSAYDAAKDI